MGVADRCTQQSLYGLQVLLDLPEKPGVLIRCARDDLEYGGATGHTDFDDSEIGKGRIRAVTYQGLAEGDTHLLAELLAVVVHVAVFVLLASC